MPRRMPRRAWPFLFSERWYNGPMRRESDLGNWGHSTVETACPLDCPDSCTLAVTVEQGRIVEIDGGHTNPTTRDFICGKVRRFGERVYGEDRLLYPAVRQGAKGRGVFTRVNWDEALDQIARRMTEIKDRWGGAAILPFSYGGSNGLLTHDTNDAELWRRFGTSRLARTVCAAPTGAANLALYGKMAGVTYADYVHANLIVLWGVNPSASGIHLVPFLKEAQHAIDLMPISKDIYDGGLVLEGLAQVYTWSNDPDPAIEQLQKLTAMPSYINYARLKFHPLWKPLRGNPRFEKLVASLGPK